MTHKNSIFNFKKYFMTCIPSIFYEILCFNFSRNMYRTTYRWYRFQFLIRECQILLEFWKSNKKSGFFWENYCVTLKIRYYQRYILTYMSVKMCTRFFDFPFSLYFNRIDEAKWNRRFDFCVRKTSILLTKLRHLG